MGDEVAITLTTPRVTQLLGITYRQLNHWITKGMFPTIEPSGSGNWIKFGIDDLCRAAKIQALSDAGFTFDKIRELLGDTE
jgi:DNA-binding transcriptional MerR regulator